jgi:hypothetical protein
LFAVLGLLVVGGVDAGFLGTWVLGHDPASFLGGDLAAVGVADEVVLAGPPAGHDAGQQGRGDVADRGVVVSLAGHQPHVLRGELGVGFAGVVGGQEEGFPQQRGPGPDRRVRGAGRPGPGQADASTLKDMVASAWSASQRA